MSKKDNCIFFAPYRDEKTHRPHPSKPGVCRYPVSIPTLPKAYKPCLEPMPIYPRDCAGCPYRTKQGMIFVKPHLQKDMFNTENNEQHGQ